MPSRCCWCSINFKEEIISHVFLRSPSCYVPMEYLCALAGIDIEGKHIVQVINEWWNYSVNTSLKTVSHDIPSLIVWMLWKKINFCTHGMTVSINRMIFQVSNVIHMLLKARRIGFSSVTTKWPDLHDKLHHHILRLKYTRVLW